MKKTRPIKRSPYKAIERKERLRILELYDGPTTDTAAAVRHMELIHQWIKTGKVPSLLDAADKKIAVKLVDKNP